MNAPDYHLVVSVPPHDAGWDVAQCATALKIAPAEMRVKTSFPAPEIWAADRDEVRAEAIYEALRRGGLNVLFTDSRILSALPTASVVEGFTVRKGGISWHVNGSGENVETPFCSRAIVIYGNPKPPATGPAAPRKSRIPSRGSTGKASRAEAPAPLPTSEASVAPVAPDDRTQVIPAPIPIRSAVVLEKAVNPAFLNLYFEHRGEVTRLLVAQGEASFAGLGDQKASTFGDNCEILGGLIRKSFLQVEEDVRLMELVPRKPTVVGAGIQRFLEALPHPKQESAQVDLASRLVYLTLGWVRDSVYG